MHLATMLLTRRLGTAFPPPPLFFHAFNLSRHLSYSSSSSSSNLFVGGLSWGVDEKTLRDAFASYGSVTGVEIATDCETGKSKGYGFVSFASNEEAGAALHGMNGRDLLGRTIRADYAVENMGGFRASLKALKNKHSHGSSTVSNLEDVIRKVDIIGTYDNTIGGNWRNL